MDNFEFIKIKNEDEIIETNVPIKKEGIYYLSGKEKYWIISSGKDKDLQNFFIEKGIVGLSWDKILIRDIKNNEEESAKKIIEKAYASLRRNYKDERSFKTYISSIYKKLVQFIDEISIGDIIVLKDRGNRKVYFGKILSDVSEVNDEDLYVDNNTGYCNKIRRVHWIKGIKKNKAGSELKLAFFSRHAILNVQSEKVCDEINREMFTYFYKGKNLHIVFGIGEDDNIKYDSFKKFQDYIYTLKEKAISIKGTENNFNIKANIQSPGPIEFFGNAEIIKYIYTFITENSTEILTGITGSIGAYKTIKRILNITNPKKEIKEIKDKFKEGN